jgi:hypothetical protein
VESILNILWVIIAIAGVCLWRFRWLRQERCLQRKPAQEWTAIICVLVVLFFAVSLTDDLHSETVLYDECASGRRYSAVWTGAHLTAAAARTTPVAGASILPRILAIELPRRSETPLPTDAVPFQEAASNSAFGRAPPNSNL